VGNLYDTTDAAGQQEFPPQAFEKIVSLIVALNQFTYAFDPRILGAIHDVTGSYTASLDLYILLQGLAAGIVLWQLCADVPPLGVLKEEAHAPAAPEL
jgi:hypothetical protein